jgi:hypothetical protein
MSVSLYDLSVASYLQVIGGVAGFLEKGAKHCAEHNIDPDSLVEARIHADMFPLQFQIQSVAHHSLGAIEGLKKGQFTPPPSIPAQNYKGLQKIVADTRDALAKFTPADVNGLSGRDVTFQLRDFKLPFTAEGFIMSFSLPNFYFHGTTAYDILRMKGVPLGKRDYMGQLRMKS